MKKFFYLSLAAMALCVAPVAMLNGCATKLSPTGVYNGDAYLYQIDQTISLQKEALHAFVKWEYDNRSEITNRWPAVTVAADKIRAQAPKWFALEGLARADYIAAKEIYDRAIKSPSSATNDIPNLAPFKATLTDQINIVASHIGDAQVSIDTTTLVNKPNLLTPPAK